MKNKISAISASFSPQQYKSFEGALSAFFERECPSLGGFMVRKTVVNAVSDMVSLFYPETSHLKPGQTTWVTVAKDEKCSYGKRIQSTRLTPVVLDLVTTDEAKERGEGRKLRDIKIEATARLFTQAFDQGGCMTNAEVAILLKIAPQTRSGHLLPSRGTIHDIGPSLTHKRIIIRKLFVEQKSVLTVARETFHSFEAIQRYVGTFKQVLLCRQKQLSTEEIAFTIGRTVRLVREYEEIIDELAGQGKAIEKILEFDKKRSRKEVE